MVWARAGEKRRNIFILQDDREIWVLCLSMSRHTQVSQRTTLYVERQDTRQRRSKRSGKTQQARIHVMLWRRLEESRYCMHAERARGVAWAGREGNRWWDKQIEGSEWGERWIMKGFIIYCFHIETCHVYDITTNESLIEYKASVMNSTSGGECNNNFEQHTRHFFFFGVLVYPLCTFLLLFVHNVYSIIFHSLYYGDGGKKLWRQKGSEGRGRNPSSSCEKNSHTQFACVG